jgi:hypothetical protein
MMLMQMMSAGDGRRHLIGNRSRPRSRPGRGRQRVVAARVRDRGDLRVPLHTRRTHRRAPAICGYGRQRPLTHGSADLLERDLLERDPDLAVQLAGQ